MFEQDLLKGKKVEEEVAELLIALGYKVEFNDATSISGLKLWDIKGIKDTRIETFEIKADFMFSKTGNVAIEEKCVKESEANYFVYKLEDEFWYTLRSNLLCELRLPGKFVYGGDGNRAKLKLVKGEDFKKYSKKLN